MSATAPVEVRSARFPAGMVVAARALPPAIVGIATLTIAVRTPLWRDEWATYSFASLDPVGLLRAVGHVDAVLTPYYLLSLIGLHLVPASHLLLATVGLRLPSVLATIGTALVLGGITRRWWGEAGAFAAGLAFALDPLVLVMGSLARPYALASFCIAMALRFLDRSLSSGRMRDWAGYAAALTLAGLMHLLALATVPALLLLVAGRGRRRILTWLATTAAAGLLVLPLAVVGYTQRAQVAWIGRPDATGALGALASLFDFRTEGWLNAPNAAALGAVLLIAAGAVLVFARARSRVALRRTVLAVALILVPWLLLLVVSLASSPILRTTYLSPSFIGVALVLGAGVRAAQDAAGAGTTRVGGRAAAVALAVVCLLPIAVGARYSAPVVAAPFRIDDFPALAARLDRDLRPGDRVVVYQPYSEGGVAVAVAIEAGDIRWARQLQKELPDAAQPVLGVRVVDSVGALVTSPGPRTSSAWRHGTTWVINAPPSVFPALARRDLGCGSARLVGTVGYGDALLARAVCTTR